ncbi:MAG TPA: YggS family pyridoxal phosphate-dependent enzyme [Clostridia bacterium]|nr:YggS family pyridoxal phosphate-dependent enzyme [Clostridia bacterium]
MERGSETDAFRLARARVRARIAEACERSGRDPGSVTLVAVSKTVPPERLRDALAAGIDLLGENRVQEALAKMPDVPGARWHLIGPLQSNKARRAAEAFEVIETVDSVDLARRLDRIVRELDRAALPVLLQVNVDRDPSKAGFSPAQLGPALDSVAGLDRLDVRGLMTIGRLVERPADARATFAGLRDLAGALRAAGAALGPELSMGMSDDYPLAVEEGATIVRVGRALFGERPHAHEPGDDALHRHGPDDRHLP